MKSINNYLTESKSVSIDASQCDFIAIESNGDKTYEIIPFKKEDAKDYAFEATDEVLKLKPGHSFFDSEIIFIKLK